MKICRVSLTEKSRLQPHDITNQPSVMHNRGSISPKLPCPRKRDRTFDRVSHEHRGFYCSNSYMHKRETQYFYSLFIDSWFLLLRFLCPSCTRLGVLNAVTMLYQRLYIIPKLQLLMDPPKSCPCLFLHSLIPLSSSCLLTPSLTKYIVTPRLSTFRFRASSSKKSISSNLSPVDFCSFVK
jgi:hypothetical protein